MQQCRYLCIPADFRSTVSSEQIEGQEKLMDLSFGGCRIECDVHIATGTALELRVHVPNVDRPLTFALARVRWARGRAWDVEFIGLLAGELARLRQLMKDLEV